MRILAVDAALDCCSAALLVDGVIIAERTQEGAHGQAETLPLLVMDLLTADRRIDAIGVTTGPGSFTGLRTALSLAQGLAMGSDAQLIGVTVGEAIRQAHAPQRCWVAIKASRDRIFLDREGAFELFDRNALPSDTPPTHLVLAGNAADMAAEFYGSSHTNVTVLREFQPLARAVAYFCAGKLNEADTIFAPVVPLYGDAPAIKRTAMRPAPTIANLN